MSKEVDFKVEDGILSPADIWKEKERFTEMETRSKQEWEKMDQEHREAILDIVDRALDRLKQNLGTWVPYSIEPKSGRYLNVTFRVVFSDIDDEVLAREAADRKSIEEAKKSVVKIVQEYEQEEGDQADESRSAS